MQTTTNFAFGVALGVAFFGAAGSLAAQPDLAVTYCSASPANGLVPGQQIVVNYDVQNVGNFGTAQFWGDRVLWNTVPSPVGNVRHVECRNFPFFILPGQSYSQFNANFPLTISVPSGLSPGTYWVGYQANYTNSQQGPCTPAGWFTPESDYGNNIKWTQVSVVGPPVYGCSNVAVSQPWAEPGQTVDVSFDITNSGGPLGLGSVAAAVYLSSNGSPSGPILAQGPFVTVAPGGTLPVTIPVTVPNLPFGAYQFVVDCAFYGGTAGVGIGSVPFQVAPVASAVPFGGGCGGAVEPVLAAQNLPVLDSIHVLEAMTASPLTPVVFVIGLADFDPGIDLAPLGMPGCLGYVDPLTTALYVSQTDKVQHQIPIGSQPALLGVELFSQVLAVVGAAPQVNPAGIVTSVGLASRIGR